MRRIEAGQRQFFVSPDNQFVAEPESDQPAIPEREYRVESTITFSKLEKLIRGEKTQESTFNFEASAAIGSAIDHALVPANFVYRYRDNYCFPEELYPEWKIEPIFANFYPTDWDRYEILDLLKKHRPRFFSALAPANLALERKSIKENLIPLWNEIAKSFCLDNLHQQSTLGVEDNQLFVTKQTASAQTIWEIGQRIINLRFDRLVDDDKDYTYIAKPDCMLVIDIEGEPVHIHIQPDYIKRLREKRKSTKKRHIVTKRHVGDFKNTHRKDLSDYSTPFGQTMLVYNWLLMQIGQRFKSNQLKRVRYANQQVRFVFLIPQEVKNPIKSDEVETNIAFLHEEQDEIFTSMPQLTPQAQKLAQNLLKKAVIASRKSRFS